MLDVLVNDKLKTICLTYPKGASSSIRTILKPGNGETPFNNALGNEWILDETILQTVIHKHLAKYPDYKIYAFCREPVERWATGLLFIMHTKWDLFYSDVSNAGQDIADNASNEYIKQLVSSMISINNYRCDFNDIHLWRPLFTLLQIKLIHGDRVHLMPLSAMERVLCDIHDSPRQEFIQINTSADGYSRGHGHHDNSSFIANLHNRWKQVIVNAVVKDKDFVAVSNYLSIENKIYQEQVLSGQDAESIFFKILDDPECLVATDLFCGDLASYSSFIDHIESGSELHSKAVSNKFHFMEGG